MRHFLCAIALVAGVSGNMAVGADDNQSETAEDFHIWDTTLNLRAGFGYKDNLLLSSVSPERSALFASEAELTLLRLPVDGHEVFVFAYGKDTRYFEGQSVDSEQFVLGLIRYRRYLPSNWKAGGSFQYLYQNQVVDVSITDTNRGSVLVQGHSIKLTPALRKDFARNYWWEFEPFFTRQLFADPLDDYWEPGPRLTWGRRYGYKSELSLSSDLTWRAYDNRTVYTSEGQPVPGEGLVYLQKEIALRVRHNWDRAGHWQTTTRLTYCNNDDNGSGYFDFDRYQAVQSARYQQKTWEIRGQVRGSYYDYPVQQVSAVDESLRHRFTLGGSLRAELEVMKRVKVFGEYEYERTWGNTSYDRYTVNTIAGGIDVGW